MNFSNNVVEFGSSAFHLDEQIYCKIEFTTCKECIGESTISIAGINDAICDINTLNFVDCVNHSDDKVLFGIFTVLYTKVIVEKSVFIMKNNKFLVMRDMSDSSSIIKFIKCTFDWAWDDLFNNEICSFVDCSFSQINPKPNKFTYFDSIECWTIKTPLPTDPIETPSQSPSTDPDKDHENYKLVLYICIINSTLLFIIIIYLIIKCIIDKKKNDELSSTFSLNESLIK